VNYTPRWIHRIEFQDLGHTHATSSQWSFSSFHRDGIAGWLHVTWHVKATQMTRGSACARSPATINLSTYRSYTDRIDASRHTGKFAKINKGWYNKWSWTWR